MGDAMKILSVECFDDEPDEGEEYDYGTELYWDIVFTLDGSSEECYERVKATDNMQAYIKAIEVAQKWEKEALKQKRANLQADLKAFKDLKKLMPNVDMSDQVAKTKKLLTDVNK